VKASPAAPIQAADSRPARLGLACLIVLGLVAFLGIGAPPASAVDTCPNEVFRTGPSAKLPDCRAYELVSPRYTGGLPIGFSNGPINEMPSPGDIELISPSNADVLFQTESGSLTGYPGTGDIDRYRAKRTAEGWETELVGVRGDQVADVSRPGAASPDHDYFFAAAAGPTPSLWQPWIGQSKVEMLRTPSGFEPLARGSLGDDPGFEPGLEEYNAGKMITENATHVFFVSKKHLEPLAAPEGRATLYDRTPGGPTKVVSLLPGNQPSTEEARWLGATEDGSEVAFELGGSGQTDWGGSPIFVRRNGNTQEAVQPYGIDGIVVGKELTCIGEPGTATISYQWLRDGSPIGGATSAGYTVAASDAGAVVQCQVTASNGEGKSIKTSITRLVEPYQETETPEVRQLDGALIGPSGNASAVGTQLTCIGTDFHVTGATYAFRWFRDGTEIAGQSANTYTPPEADVGHSLQCRKAVSNGDGAAVVYSNSVSITLPYPQASSGPAIANSTDPGDALEAGDELSCSSGTWSGSPSFVYQWLRDGAEIAGATANTYTVAAEDEGKTLQCRVNATNAAGAAQAISSRMFFSSGLTAQTHPFLETFGSAAQPSFSYATSVAVDQSSGDLLVVDPEAGTISRFKPDGTPDNFSALGTNVISETPEGAIRFPSAEERRRSSVQVAVDNSGTATNGDIYVATGTQEESRIDIFASSGAFLGKLDEYKEGAGADGSLLHFSERACGVAVAPNGDVYASDSGGFVHKYVPSANPPTAADNSANFSYPEACTLAAGIGPTAGFVFVDSYGGGEGELAKLDGSTGAIKYAISSGVRTVSVDPSSGHVYALTGSQLTEFDASGAASASSVSTTELNGRGVAIRGSNTHVFVAAQASANVSVYGPAVAFAPEPPEQLSSGGVSGSPQVGSSLFCEAGSWSGRPTFSYQWLRNGTEIPGATDSSYALTTEDLAKVVQCRLTATNAIGGVVALGGSSHANYVIRAVPSASASMPAQSLTYAGIYNGHLFYADRYSDPIKQFYALPADLYSYDLDSGKSTPITDTGDAAFVNVSQDGSHVYFVRTFETGGEKSGKLYVWNRADDSTTLIAEISGEDATSFRLGEAGLITWTGAVGPYKFGLGHGRGMNHTRSTPDGSVLTFEATTQLSSFDNTEATPETCTKTEEHDGELELCEEAYRYDANTEQLTCVSCGSGSGPATGEAQLLRYEAMTRTAPNNLSNDGNTVFFESTEALVPRDVNHARDVYRWQAGKGVALISTGQGRAESSLFAASRDGSNVLFTTREQLLPEDENGSAIRIYDARVNGGFPPPESRVTEPCAGDVCQGAPAAAPAPPQVASSSLNGGGNVKSRIHCGKGRRRVVRHGKERHGRERCVKRRRHHHRRGGANRRAAR